LELGGGGIAAFDKILRVRFSTITSNQAVSDSPGGGGGIYVASISSTRLDGSILTANNAVQGSQCVGSVATGGYNVHSDSSGCEWPSHVGDKLVTSADLGTLGAHGGPTHTIPLKSGSPALNIASKAHCDGLKVDQRGVKRPQKTKCDAGAYELKA
jgi:hypothetical protein